MPRVHPIARLFGLGQTEFWARHANPWSFWTRVPVLALATAILWFRELLGPLWFALLAALAIWSLVNPRLFPPVAPNSGWIWRCVMGERLWTGPERAALPAHHRAWGKGLGLAQGAAMALWLLGLAWRDPALALGGAAAAMMFKFWFLDRMAWLHDEAATPPPPAPSAGD